MAERRGELGLEKRKLGILLAGQQIQGDRREQFEGYHRRDRIPRKSENRRAGDPPENQGLAGLNQDAGDKELRPQFG